MRRKCICLLMLLLTTAVARAVSVDITVTQPGTLFQELLQKVTDLESVTELTVHGELDNYDDMTVFVVLQNLEVLDLSDARASEFRSCMMLTKLRQVVLPPNAKLLDEQAFMGCESLTSVTLSPELEQIGYGAFQSCSALTTLSLPSTLKTVRGNTFNGCSALKDVYCYSRDYTGSLFSNYSISGVTFHVHTTLVDFFRQKESSTGISVVGMEFNFASLNITYPIKVTDVKYYQDADVSFDTGYVESNHEYTMGSLELDAPADTKWQMKSFKLPVSIYDYDTNYDREDPDKYEDVFHIATMLNHRTPVEARQIEVNLGDSHDLDWTFFSVPFDVNVSDIKGGRGQWVIRRYDATNRAATKAGETWVDVKEGETLHAGEGYIFMRDYDNLYGDYNEDDEYDEEGPDDYRIILPAAETDSKQKIFASGDVVVPLKKAEAKKSHNADWNLVGNPYPCFYDIRDIKEKVTIYIFDEQDKKYISLTTGGDLEAYLPPCISFFVQATDADQLTFQASGRRLKASFGLSQDDDPDDDISDDDEWPDEVRQRIAAMSRKAPAATAGFNPESPKDPAANYFNNYTGEAYFDLFKPGYLMYAMEDLFDGIDYHGMQQVKKLTVAAPMVESDFFFFFNEATVIDLGESSGFQTVPSGAFYYTPKLQRLVLPACVTSIADDAFNSVLYMAAGALEQLDVYATTPPSITNSTFSIVKDKANFLVRVPKEAVATYKSAPVWKNFNIQPLEGQGEELQSVSIAVLTPDGNSLTDQCSILWTDMSGTLLGVGSTLMAQAVGTTVRYSIGLPSAVAALYVPVTEGTYTVQPSGNIITINLVATGVADLGTKQLLGSRGTLDVTFVASNSDAPTVFDATDIQLAVTNKDTGAPITDFVVEYPTLSFEQTQLQPGQTLQLSLSSRNGIFQTAQAEAAVDAEGSFSAAFTVKEWGQAAISCTPAEDVSGIMALVFDSNERFVARFNATGNIVRVNALPDGSYYAVVIQQNQYLNAVASLADLRQTVLSPGTDYTQLSIRLTAGTTSTYEATVPALDESRISHINTESYITTNDPELNVGTNATLKAKVVFKEEYASRVGNVNLIVDIPEGMAFVEKSLISSASSYQLTGQRFVIPCQPGEQVRWSLSSDRSGQNAVTAMVQYVLDGQQYLQPIGSATIEVTGIVLDVATTNNTPQMNIRGYAFGGSHVTIYDGRAVVAETTAKNDGTFSADITLTPAYDGTLHRIYADIVTSGQPKVSTETATVFYDKNASVLKQVSMLFQNQCLRWNNQTGELVPSYYNVDGSQSSTVTFTAQFDNPKPQCILDPSFEVTASDGSVQTLRATWDESTRLYTAVADYASSYSMPVSVDFDFAYADSTAYSRQELFDAEVSRLVSAHNQLVEGIENTVKVGRLLVDEEDRMQAEFTIGNEPPFLISAQIEDYDRVMSLLEELKRPYINSIIDGDTVATFFVVNSPQSTTVYFANIEKHDAHSETIETPGVAAARPNRISWGGILNKVGGFFNPSPSNLLDINKKINEYNGRVEDAANALEALNYIDEMQARYDEYNNSLSNRINICQYALLARCRDGKLRVPESMFGHFQSEIRRLDENRKVFCKQMQGLILSYCHALENAGYKEITKELAKFTAKYLTKAGVKRCGGVLNNMAKTGLGTAQEFGQFVGDVADDGMGTIIDKFVDKLAKEADIPTDYKGVRAFFESWTPKEYHKHSMAVTDLRYTIQASYKKCKDEEIDRPPIKWAKKRWRRRARPIIDPSGFVYEATPDNRIEGVTATVYYKENEGAAEVMWDATEYGQQNPLKTNAAGVYMWNVPQGLWQVRFEKEGYQPAKTEWLPVPPPQLEVNIPMTRTSAPVVKEALAFSDHVSITFDRHIQTSTLQGITLRQNGQTVTGTVQPVDETDGLTTCARFTPAASFTAKTVELTVPVSVKSYAGVPLASVYTTTLTVEHPIEGMIVGEGTAIQLGQTGYVTVTAYPAVAASGRELRVSSTSPQVSLESGTVLRFDDNGQCMVPFSGLLPGVAEVTFAVGDIEARANVEVKYRINDVCARPVASITSGAAVVSGTRIELYSATEGAVIYYTTDGSCPCDEAKRQRYSEPIVITEPVTIQAMAVCEGMDDSEVVTYSYGIGTYSGIETSVADGKADESYYSLRGMKVVPPLSKGVYIHVQRTPQGMKSRKIFIK